MNTSTIKKINRQNFSSGNIFSLRTRFFFILSALFFTCAFFITSTQAAWNSTAMIAGNIVSTGIWGDSVILTPTEGETVGGTLDLIALYVDENGDGNDGVQWAVRAGTCAVGTNTRFGNVDGFNTSFNWDGRDFTSTIDTTSVADGAYCFVFNPSEDAGDANQRLTRNFFIMNTSGPIVCDSNSSFDDFTPGSVNGQDGWSATGPFDQEVVENAYGYPSFGCQTLRLSNAVTSGSFGNQIFSDSITNEAGETDALNGGLSGGTRQSHFSAEFDIAAATTTHQPGLAITVSPDRGDGARMSFLRFTDTPTGIDVIFFDVQSVTDPAVFAPTTIAIGLFRTMPHTVRFEMEFVDGPSNDVVKIYINNVLVHTGTSWENYYRFDSESNPGLTQNNSRTVDSLLFRLSGIAATTTLGAGFLIDNYTLVSSGAVIPPAPPVPFVPGPGDVVINEIMWMGSASSTADEWLELRNMTSESIDLTNWTIENGGIGTPGVITLSGAIGPNGFFLISRQTAAVSAMANIITVDQIATLSFANDGEVLTLRNNSSSTIDQTPLGAWPAGVNATVKQSMERNNVPGDGTQASSWHTCIDVPGCHSNTFWDINFGLNYGTPRAANLSENDPTAEDFNEGLFGFAATTGGGGISVPTLEGDETLLDSNATPTDDVSNEEIDPTTTEDVVAETPVEGEAGADNTDDAPGIEKVENTDEENISDLTNDEALEEIIDGDSAVEVADEEVVSEEETEANEVVEAVEEVEEVVEMETEPEVGVPASEPGE